MSDVTTPKIRQRSLSDDAHHILIVDDDARIRSLLSRYLVDNGFRVSLAENAQDARSTLKHLRFDALIVDVMMPGEDGVSLTEALKKVMDVPVLMLTAKSENQSRIKGLEVGADDYLTKPFEPRELLLRLQNLLRWARPHEAAASPQAEVIDVGSLKLTVATGELQDGQGAYIKLTEKERLMLQYFARAEGRTVSRDELIGLSGKGSSRAVDVHINRLRRKIEQDPSNPRLLQTVRGLGYRLRVGS